MDTSTTDLAKTTPPQNNQDSGYQSTMDSSMDSSHLKTSSISSSGYYSRLDSVDSVDPTPSQLPWQHYVTIDDSELTPLHKSVISKNAELLQKILQISPHPSVLNVQTEFSLETALHFAVKMNEIDVKDFQGNNVVHLAARYGFCDVLELLTVVNDYNYEGRFFLHYIFCTVF